MKNSRRKRQRVVELTERLIENKYDDPDSDHVWYQKERDKQELEQLVRELNSPADAGIREVKDPHQQRGRRRRSCKRTKNSSSD